MPPQTPQRDQALRPGERATRPGLDQSLLTRLWQRAERPGCVRHSQARTILARHQRMAADPPLAGLLLRRGRGSADLVPAPPVIVDARPADTPLSDEAPRPGAVPLSGAVPPRVTGPSAARARPKQPNDLATSPPQARAMTPAPDTARRDSPGETTRLPRAASRPPVPPARPVTVTSVRPGSPLQPAAESAPLVTNGADPGQASPLPVAGPPPSTGPHPPVHPVPLTPPQAPPSPGPPAIAPPAGAGSPAAYAHLPIATGRPAPRSSVRPPDAGPGLHPAENGRPVVRAGTDGTLPRPATLAWPRPAPDPAAGSARRSVPLVREQASPGAWRPSLPAAQRPGQLPFAALPPDRAAPDRTPGAPGRATTAAARTPSPAELAGLAIQASGPRDPARPAAPRTPPEAPPVRLADQARQEREPPRPAIDINQIVSTVQRRLIHQMAIERERRGMAR
jgi:hypothetical protein